MKCIIRKRKKEDAEDLAYAIAKVWNDTYQGIVEQSFLDNMYNYQSESANRIISNIDNQPNYYILEINKSIAGWVYFEFESDKYNSAAEIHSLYVLKEYQGYGYGRLLYNYVVENIKNKGINKLVIGCLDGNKSNGFYKHMSGKYIKNSLFRNKYKENIYLFEL